MLKGLFGGGKTELPQTKLPQVRANVDVIVAGRPARQVTVEAVSAKGIVTSSVVGRAGETAVILYTAAAGRFRAETKIAGTSATSTQFEPPKRVSLIGAATGAQKRQSVRLDALVNGFWRFAPQGKGTGGFVRCTIRDISRSGCALLADRPLKLHTQVEVQFALRDDSNLTLLAEVMRHEQIAASGKHSHGLRFHGVRPDEDQAIVEFINRKQAELRSRGLA